MNSISVIELTCRPSVVSSFFRTLWNGWPTTYRMRTMSGAPKTQQCVLGCRGAEDRIEHYLVCKKVWAALEGRPPQGLGIHRSRQKYHSDDAGRCEPGRCGENGHSHGRVCNLQNCALHAKRAAHPSSIANHEAALGRRTSRLKGSRHYHAILQLRFSVEFLNMVFFSVLIIFQAFL